MNNYIYRYGVINSMHYVRPGTLKELVRRAVWGALRATLGKLAKATNT